MKFKRIAAAAAAVTCAASLTAVSAFADDNVAGVAGVAGEASPVATAATTTVTEETTVETTAATTAATTEAPEEETSEEETSEEEVIEEELVEAEGEVVEEELFDDAAPEELDPFASLTFQDLLAVEDPSEFGMTDEEFGMLALTKLCDEYGLYLGSGTSSNWGQAVKLLTYNNSEDEPGDDYFNSDLLTPESMVIVFYESETAPEFILQSWSGGEGWAKVPANEEASVPGIAVFTYDYMTAMYQSEDFSTLDAIYVGDTGSDLVVKGAYLIDANSLLGALGIDLSDLEADLDFDESDFEDYDEEYEDEEPEFEEEEPVEIVVDAPAPSADGDVPSANTGNMSVAAIAGIMAVAGAAALAVRKRK